LGEGKGGGGNVRVFGEGWGGEDLLCVRTRRGSEKR